MAAKATFNRQMEAGLFHDSHLELLEYAEMMGDIMYFHQAIRQPDAQDFVKTIVKEVEAHVNNNHWGLVEREDVPPDTDILPAEWAIYCKRNLTTNEIKCHKTRLNNHSGKQVYCANYFETFLPVVTCFAIQDRKSVV